MKTSTHSAERVGRLSPRRKGVGEL